MGDIERDEVVVLDEAVVLYFPFKDDGVTITDGLLDCLLLLLLLLEVVALALVEKFLIRSGFTLTP